jgi:hypothetical protein
VRQEAPGAEKHILENQSSGLFVLLSLAWIEAWGSNLDWPMHIGREVPPLGLKPNSH